MKAFKTLLVCLLSIVAIAQNSDSKAPYLLPIDKGSVKASYPLGISHRKTTHIIFPAKIKDFDAGSSDVIAQVPEAITNILRLKAKKQGDFCETNVTVLTEDGGFYSFLVHYQEDPPVLNINIANNLLSDEETAMKQGINRGASVSYVLPTATDNTQELLFQCQRVQTKNGFVKHVGDSKFKISLKLVGIYVENQLMYLQFLVKNEGEISYEVDFFKFFLRDKDSIKRMATQEIEVKSLAHYPAQLAVIRSKTEHSLVFALPLQPIEIDKVIEVEMYEKLGGRHMKFQIEHDVLMMAKGI